jgi:hypothetical protein
MPAFEPKTPFAHGEATSTSDTCPLKGGRRQTPLFVLSVFRPLDQTSMDM